MSSTKFFCVAVSFIIVLVSFGCNAKPEVISGAAYVKYPKADILGQIEVQKYTYILLICDPDSRVRLLDVYDSTVFGKDSAELRNEKEISSSVSCGSQLQELKRLAEIGEQYDNKVIKK